jgi:hypothetical protein
MLRRGPVRSGGPACSVLHQRDRVAWIATSTASSSCCVKCTVVCVEIVMHHDPPEAAGNDSISLFVLAAGRAVSRASQA